jgi:hypothetical protein
VTASSFESALAYVRTRFDDAVVLARHDHGRRWPRVTLEVSTDPETASEAPPLSELARPPQPVTRPPAPEPRVAPVQPERGPEPVPEPASSTASDLPTELEAIFAHQNHQPRR